MSNPSDADDTPIASVQQLVDHLAAGGKPKAQWRIGTEHEKFGFRHADYASPPYAPGGIRALLDGMASPDWEEIPDAGVPIGLKGLGPRDGASLSLEPGGQFELSGAPLRTLHDTKAELDEHCATVSPRRRDAGDRLRAARLPPDADPRAGGVDAEKPLRHHAALHAAHRHHGVGHDAAHLHGAGEPRLCQRGGHCGASCAMSLALQPLGDGAVRQLAV